jgi:hypothetical protein
MNIAIEKQNLSNNKWQVLRMHMQFIFFSEKKVNVFIIKDLETIMCYISIQFQRDELVLSHTFWNTMH